MYNSIAAYICGLDDFWKHFTAHAYNCCLSMAPGSYADANPATVITNCPGFVDPQAQDFHLAPGSVCIDRGAGLWVTSPWDLDGAPRSIGADVDAGVYEFIPEPAMLLWLLPLLMLRARPVDVTGRR